MSPLNKKALDKLRYRGASAVGQALTVINDDGDVEPRNVGGGTPLPLTIRLSGGNITWLGGLDFRISACDYLIAGTEYTSPEQDFSLSAADPTDDRTDLITLDTSGAVVVIEGDPSTPPVEPLPDTDIQCPIVPITIEAGATTPVGVGEILVYDENVGTPTELDASGTDPSINVAATDGPFSGTVNIRATNAPTGTNILFEDTGAIDAADVTTLIFRVQVVGSWSKKLSLKPALRMGADVIGNPVVVNDGAYGFSRTFTADYQQIVVPISHFALPDGAVFDTIRLLVAATGGAVGNFRIDDVRLQTNVPQPPEGTGLPPGGVAGQVLEKLSAADFAAGWKYQTYVQDTDPGAVGARKLWVESDGSLHVRTLDNTGWIDVSGGGGGGSLATLSDVDLTGLADGDTLIYDLASLTWKPGPMSGGASALDDLTDVTITTPANGDYVVRRAGVFVNDRIEGADLDAGIIQIASLEDIAALSVLARSVNSSGPVAALAAGANDRLLARVGNALAFQQLTVGMIPDALVTLAKLADMAGPAVLGRAAGSTGVMAAITASADDRLLIRTGGALSFGQVTVGMVPDSILTPEKQTNAGRDRWITVQFGDGLTAGIYGTGLLFDFRAGCNGDWTEFETDADASCSTSIQVTKNGTTIFSAGSTKPTLTAATHEDKTSMSNIVTSFAKNDHFVVSVSTFTSGTPKQVSLTLYYRVKT